MVFLMWFPVSQLGGASHSTATGITWVPGAAEHQLGVVMMRRKYSAILPQRGAHALEVTPMHREGHGLIIPRKKNLIVGPLPACMYLPFISTHDHDAQRWDAAQESALGEGRGRSCGTLVSRHLLRCPKNP